MLKKITWISALILAACLIVGTVLIPLTIREFLQNGEQLVGKFVRSTEVYSFDAKDITNLELNFNDLTVYIEQSKDNNVYLRMEGLFADRYALSDQIQQAEGQKILSVSIDSDSLFFDTSSPYLLRSGLVNTSAAWIIVRVPSWISVETLGNPWNLRYTENVQFQNRSYYDGHLWYKEEDETKEPYPNSLSLYCDRFEAMKGAFESEMRKDLVQLEAGEINLSVYNNRLDEAAKSHLDRMEQQLFPRPSELFDLDTLTTLLENYFELYRSSMKQRGLMQNSEAFSGEYELLQSRYVDLQEAADTALEEFLDYYRGYLADLEEMGTEAPESAETAAPEEMEDPEAAAASEIKEAEMVSSLLDEQANVLSVPPVHAES